MFVCDSYNKTTGVNAVADKNITQILIFLDSSPEAGFPDVQECININLKSCCHNQSQKDIILRVDLKTIRNASTLIQFNTRSCRMMWKGRETRRPLQQSRSRISRSWTREEGVEMEKKVSGWWQITSPSISVHLKYFVCSFSHSFFHLSIHHRGGYLLWWLKIWFLSSVISLWDCWLR